ncbi:hypothetical protein GWL_15990 [Herbaspirillum sp. GW103]|nr:hypothetical protein GWL_15990 [Herbaspirillum sp. GW103]
MVRGSCPSQVRPSCPTGLPDVGRIGHAAAPPGRPVSALSE